MILVLKKIYLFRVYILPHTYTKDSIQKHTMEKKIKLDFLFFFILIKFLFCNMPRKETISFEIVLKQIDLY